MSPCSWLYVQFSSLPSRLFSSLNAIATNCGALSLRGSRKRCLACRPAAWIIVLTICLLLYLVLTPLQAGPLNFGLGDTLFFSIPLMIAATFGAGLLASVALAYAVIKLQLPHITTSHGLPASELMLLGACPPLALLVIGKFREQLQKFVASCMQRELQLQLHARILAGHGNSWDESRAILAAAHADAAGVRQAALKAFGSRQLLAPLNHELRNSLNVIIGFCELAEEEMETGDAAEARDHFRLALVAAQGLLQLLNTDID